MKTKLPTPQSIAGSFLMIVCCTLYQENNRKGFSSAVLFNVPHFEVFTGIPWRGMVLDYWNTASFLFMLLKSSLFFYIFCALEENTAVTFSGVCLSSHCFSMAFKSVSGIQFICILMPLLWSIPFCQLSASFRCFVFGSYGINKLTISSVAYPLAGNFHPFAIDHYSSNSFSRTIYFHLSRVGVDSKSPELDLKSLGFVWRPYAKHESKSLYAKDTGGNYSLHHISSSVVFQYSRFLQCLKWFCYILLLSL